jgi:Uma2 family endonuclease
MLVTEPTARRWSMDEYYRVGELGFFSDQRVELIDGEIIEMAPQKDRHAVTVSLVFKAVWRTMPEGLWVRSQLPLHLSDTSEPEPDLSVVVGPERAYVGKGHPKTALLAVEVSDTFLRFDRGPKSSLYAGAGIKDYWMVNLIDRCVEVYGSPTSDNSSQFGFRYADKSIFSGKDAIKPLAASGEIAVADLLP